MARRATIEPTGDGTQTLRHPLFGETYHSVRGAVGESEHVFIDAGLRAAVETIATRPLRILEIGLGSGLNGLLTARYAIRAAVPVDYTAVELYPVEEEVWSAMEYASDPLFGALHRAPWGERVLLTEGFTLKKIAADLAGMSFGTTFDLLYMDAFAPDTQPQLWSPQVFEKLYACTATGGILVTYCAKGEVKRALRAAGYTVERLPGALGKRHMLRAVRL